MELYIAVIIIITLIVSMGFYFDRYIKDIKCSSVSSPEQINQYHQYNNKKKIRKTVNQIEKKLQSTKMYSVNNLFTSILIEIYIDLSIKKAIAEIYERAGWIVIYDCRGIILRYKNIDKLQQQ